MRNLKLVCQLAVSALLLLSGGLNAQFSQQLISDRGSEITIQTQLLDYQTTTVSINGKENLAIRLPNGAYTALKGFPDLPSINKSVIIPDDQEMSVEVVACEYKDISVEGIIPSRGTIFKNQVPSQIPYSFAEVYNQDSWYPQNSAKLGEPFIHRDFRGALLQVTPFQYNPVKKILRVFSSITVKISSAGLGKVNVFKRSKYLAGIDAEYDQIYAHSFINYNPTKYPLLNEEGSLLIISHADFIPTLQPLIDWKRKKGLQVNLVDVATIGTTAAALKSYIVNQYNNPANNLKYVLLVGDYNKVPTDKINGYNPSTAGSDVKLAELAGTDCYAEVFIGRFSGITAADIKTQVDRTIYYETSLKTTDTWLSNILGSASSDSEVNQWGETDADFINSMNDTLTNNGFTNFFRLNENAVGGTGCTTGNSSTISEKINSGVGFYIYSDHGSKTAYTGVNNINFSVTSVGNLRNMNKLFYTFAVACNVGEFNTGSSDCLAEAMMKSQYNGEPIGAIGCLLSTISQPWDPPYAGVREIVSVLMEKNPAKIKHTMGGALANSAMKGYEDCPNADGRATIEAWTLFGDPSLQLYTKTPASITINHPAQLMLDANKITITGSENAQVCVYNAAKNIQAVGIIKNGKVDIPLNFDTADDLYSVTGTLFNSETYQGSFTVSGSEITDRRLPESDCLAQNYPNPFNPVTTINYQLHKTDYATLAVYNAKGELVKTLVDDIQQAGYYSVNFYGSKINSGVYFYKLTVNGKSMIGKMLLLK